MLGCVLVEAHFFGLDPDQSLPIINLTLEDSRDFPRIVALLLIAFTLYLIVGWKQSSRKSRESYSLQAFAGFTILWACVSLWIGFPLIAANTGFSGVSPGWLLGFLAIGFSLGVCVSDLIFSSFMVRTPTEAKALQLPRVPIAVRAQFKTWVPVGFLLLIAFYILRHYTPEIIKEFKLELVLVCIPFLFLIGEEFSWLCLSQDENGKRIPLAKRIAQFKEAFNSHDYSYKLFEEGIPATEEIGIDQNTSPYAAQKAIQEKYAVNPRGGSFQGVLQEEIKLEFYSKDGDQENRSPENQGVRIKKQKGKKDALRTLINFDDPEKESREMEIPIGFFEKHAEKYLSSLSGDSDLDANKFISYALNNSIIQIWAEEAGPPLLRAVEAGLEDHVKELLKQNIDVNEQAEAGWTALLYASAQGYPRIVRLLLDAGANPDIGNIHGITPLMYGAMYDNLEVCKHLLEHVTNTDLQDVYGMTALMVASGLGHAVVVDKLLEAGANTAIKDRNDMTALDFAHKKNKERSQRVFELLIERELNVASWL